MLARLVHSGRWAHWACCSAWPGAFDRQNQTAVVDLQLSEQGHTSDENTLHMYTNTHLLIHVHVQCIYVYTRTKFTKVTYQKAHCM